jgi:pimeloyl-ACP methyl ester carboxylesterase
MTDSDLLERFNMLAYDRVGYNYKDTQPVQESIALERDLLMDLIKDIPSEKTILAGYSYGGPIALAVSKKVKKIILFAPAVYSKVEPMPWMLNFYKWNGTRWLVPKIWKEASKEKLSHRKDLENFELEWYHTPNEVTSIHGTTDWIVPFDNSKFLEEQFPQDQLKLIPIQEVGHNLIWSQFSFIKPILLKQ